MGFIISHTKGTLKEAFQFQCKKLSCTADKIQLLIGLKKTTTVPLPVYSLILDWDYEKKTELDFKKLTGIEWSILQKEDIAKQYFPEMIEKLAKKLNLDAEKTEIMVITDVPDAKNIGLLLYENKKLIKPISFEFFFGEGDD